MAKAENKVQLAIIKHLRAEGILCWRNNSMGVFDQKLGIYRTNPYSMRGVGDIVGVLPGGKFLSVEVKSAKGKASPEQLLFIKRCTKEGGVCFVARSVDNVKEVLADVVD